MILNYWKELLLWPERLYFGGDTPSQTTTTSTQTQVLSPQQQELLDLAIPHAEEFGKAGLELPEESGIVGFDPLQLQAQEQALALAAPGSALTDLIANITDAQNFALQSLLFPETNPALSGATDAAIRPITEAFTQSVLPNIRGGAQLAGQPGSSRQGIAEGIATGSLLRQVGDTSASFQNVAYGQGLDAFIKALALGPQTAQLQTLPASIIDLIGANRQGLDQARLTEEQGKFFNEQLLSLTVAQELAKLAGTFGGSSTIGTVTQPTGIASGGSAFGSALSGAATGFSIGGPIGAGLGGIAGLIFG
jgi:hypothetical protein